MTKSHYSITCHESAVLELVCQSGGLLTDVKLQC